MSYRPGSVSRTTYSMIGSETVTASVHSVLVERTNENGKSWAMFLLLQVKKGYDIHVRDQNWNWRWVSQLPHRLVWPDFEGNLCRALQAGKVDTRKYHHCWTPGTASWRS